MPNNLASISIDTELYIKNEASTYYRERENATSVSHVALEREEEGRLPNTYAPCDSSNISSATDACTHQEHNSAVDQELEGEL